MRRVNVMVMDAQLLLLFTKMLRLLDGRTCCSLLYGYLACTVLS